MKDITLGQYYPADSLIHRFDPRVKLLALAIYTIFLFWVDSLAGYVCNIIVLAIVTGLTRVPVKKIVKGIRSILFLLLFSVVFTVLFTKGDDVIFDYGILSITWQGI